MADISRLVNLVHRRDALLSKRAEIDLEIEEVERQLAGEGPIPPITNVSLADTGTYSDRALAWLRQHEGQLDIAQMAYDLYGAKGPKEQNKTRSVLYFLKGRKRIKRVTPRKWKVIDDSPMGKWKEADKPAEA